MAKMTENKTMDEKIIFQKAVTVAGLCNALEHAIDDLNWVTPAEKRVDYFSEDFLCAENGESISFDSCGNVNNILKFLEKAGFPEDDDEEEEEEDEK